MEDVTGVVSLDKFLEAYKESYAKDFIEFKKFLGMFVTAFNAYIMGCASRLEVPGRVSVFDLFQNCPNIKLYDSRDAKYLERAVSHINHEVPAYDVFLEEERDSTLNWSTHCITVRINPDVLINVISSLDLGVV